jgi:hypothetical protein
MTPADRDGLFEVPWALEMFICVAIVGVFLAVALPDALTFTTKVKLTELMLAVLPERDDQVEAAAHTGDYAVSARNARRPGGSSLEDALALKTTEDISGVGEELRTQRRGGTQGSSKHTLHMRTFRETGHVLMTGTFNGQPYRLPLALAVPAEGPIASTLWLCGDALPPPGWIALRGPEGMETPPGLAFHVCRQSGGGSR